jgi:replication factor C subunit 3/5
MTALWLEKAKINRPDELIFNKGIFNEWINWDMRIPNTLIIGANGSGRTTFWNLYIAHVISESASKITNVEMLTLKGKRSTDPYLVKCITTPVSVALDLTTQESHDQEVLNTILTPFLEVPPNTHLAPYRLIILEGAESLSANSQQALRLILERHVRYNRFILTTSNEYDIIEALRSRCYQVRLATPSQDEIIKVWQRVAPTPTPPIEVLEAGRYSNLKTILLYGQYHYQTTQVLKFATPPLTPQTFTNHQLVEIHKLVANPLFAIEKIRTFVQTLINQCLPFSEICVLIFMSSMHIIWVRSVSKNQSPIPTFLKLANISMIAERRVRLGNQPIYHLEFLILSLLALF